MKPAVKVVLGAVGALLVMQLAPYGRNHTNPPVVKEPAWNDPATRALAKRACFNCHSFETVWPDYASIAPASWLVYRDVIEGREHLNFSDWQAGRREGEQPDEMAKEINEGEMPPLVYRLAHPEARLSPAEKMQLIQGLRTTAAARTVQGTATH